MAPSVSQRFNQKREGWGVLAAAGIVQMEAGKWRAPICQYAHQAAFTHMRKYTIGTAQGDTGADRHCLAARPKTVGRTDSRHDYDTTAF